MPFSSPKLSYESFLEIISFFTNGLRQLDDEQWLSPTNVAALVADIPKEEGCKIFSFDFKKGVLNFSDIRKPFDSPQKVCRKNYNDILAMIWQESVYLMLGRAPTYYLPFKSIAEQAIEDLSTVVKASSIIKINEIQGMLVEYMLDIDRLAAATETLGFFKCSKHKKLVEINGSLGLSEIKPFT